MKIWQNPMTLFAAGLAVFACGALLYNFRMEVISNALLVFMAGAGTWLALKRTSWGRGHLWQNLLISLLIVFLLMNPPLAINGLSALWIMVGTVLVVLAKFFPRYKRQIIFNPAAFGLWVLGGILALVYGTESILPTFASWWGTDYAGYYSLIILLPLVLYGAYKFRKLPLLGVFLGLNLAWLYWAEGLEAVSYVYGTGMIYFMAGVMLLEPKTSPIKLVWQVVAAVVAVVVYRLGADWGLSDVELWAILSVNGVHLLSRLGLNKVLRKLFIKS